MKSPSTQPIDAMQVAERKTRSLYPEPFATRMQGRSKRALGEQFGLANFGVNLTTLEPGAVSALLHAHSHQDEFVFILQGVATLVTGEGERRLEAGMCIGFKAGSGLAHQLRNDSRTPVVYLEVGDRTAGDCVSYPEDDIAARHVEGAWVFTHKDGTPY